VISTHRAPPDQTPRVSVVIPAYRSGQTIRRAIDSVLAQTHVPAEIIVVDDGSPDDQAAVVERTYGSKVAVVRKPNGGAASARNAGIDRATGDFIAFLDADDYWERDKLALQLAIFRHHPDVGLVAGAFYEEPPDGARRCTPTRPGSESWYDRVLRLDGVRAFLVATMVFTSTVIVRRGVLGEERFPSDLTTAEDRDLWVRLVSRSAVFLTGCPVATTVLVEGSLSRSNVDRDCSCMLSVIGRHRALLGSWGTALWRSHTLYRWAAVDPNPVSALPRLLRSMMLWPLPYTGLANSRHFGRTRRLCVLLAAAAWGRDLSQQIGR
jgi:hypothetical protein